MKYVKVRFLNGGQQLYTYQCFFDVEVGSLVVVQARDSYGLATVVSVSSEPASNPRITGYKDVVSVVDFERYLTLALTVDYENEISYTQP